MPTTRRRTAEQGNAGVILTIDDVAKKITRVSGSLHSIASLINETIDGRSGFYHRFRSAGENSSANARALWRYHDRRWQETKRGAGDGDDEEDDTNEDEEEDDPIDDEVDRRIGRPFTFTRAVEAALAYLDTATGVLTTRKAEMEELADADGAALLQAFLETYEKEKEGWRKIAELLGRTTTYLGESIIDTSLRQGWL